MCTSLGLSYSIYEKTYGDAHAKLGKSSNLADKPTLADLPPHLKLLDKKVTAMHFHTVNGNPFETVNL